jgi:trimeric autotransporter adhesin
MVRTTWSGHWSAWAIALFLAAVMPARGTFAAATSAATSAAAAPAGAAAVEVAVRATLNQLPVPGATVTASQGAARFVTTTDEDGVCRLTLGDGPWSVRIEMRGFVAATREINVGAAPSTTAIDVELTLVAPGSALPDPVRESAPGMAPATPTEDGPVADAHATDDGLVIRGSVYNAAASPYAQAPAFGNNRTGARSQYNASAGVMGGRSEWDARPFSFSGRPVPAPNYADVQIALTFGGPLKLPFLRSRPVVNLSYQRSAATLANTVRSRVPTLLERTGDLSESRDSRGQAIAIVDPSTGAPFANAAIPRDRFSPQAQALLKYYPEPNAVDLGPSNHEITVADRTVRDTFQFRLGTALTTRQQVSGSVSYRRARTQSATLFQFTDDSRSTESQAAVTWSYRFSQTKSMRARYEFQGTSAMTRPFFASRVNVSGDAGIMGNDQTPDHWGPPNLNFASGLAGLTSAAPVSQQERTHLLGAEGAWLRGYHNLTFGGDLRLRRHDAASAADPRGTFTFTGAATGHDLADFLLGLPQASAIAFGDGRTFHGTSANLFVMDDWRVASPLTISAGVRWEYEGPFAERLGRLANLDLAADFVAASAVTPGTSVGAITGRRYGSALVNPDYRSVQPRIGLSWRPLAASSLLVRAGYGLYRQPNIYLPIANWLAQQPPFATVASLESTPLRPLTLADGFATRPGALPNTVAVDLDLRAGYAENWQVSVQRDLPMSLTVAATYLGIRGHRLLQQSLPNTVPPGASLPCPTCPVGFIYISSNGSSSRHAAQLQIRRRLRSGFAASGHYTLAKAVDNATAFAGVGAAGSVIAQDWRDLEGERGPSSFDQRHLFTADVEYTTGIGVSGGALLTGLRGHLLRGWVFAGQLSAGSGLPVTPRYLAPVPGTGVTGSIRASLIDSETSPTDGYFLDPAHYAPPALGEWGTAGRNSARGPAQFSFNASVGRSFTTGDRMTVDWRLDATNVLNRVTYVSVNTLVGSPEFGLPDRANPMRKLRMALRWRF